MRLFCRAALVIALSLASPGLGRAASAESSPLPPGLHVTKAADPGASDTLAVLYSGDGGWADIDQSLASGFAHAGIPSVGFNSLRYFLSGRTALGAGADLTAVLRHYMAEWGKSRIVLIGFSFGADALPAIYPKLPADLRSRVRLVGLVSPAAKGELKWQPGDWINMPAQSAYPIAPALAAMKGVNMICIYGSEEKRPACPTFGAQVIPPVKLPGGHHYGGDYEPLVRTLLGAAGN